MNFWKSYFNLKYFFFYLINFVIIIYHFLFENKKRNLLKKNNQLSNIFRNQQWIIVGNSPALKNLEIKKFINKNTIFMNRGYLIDEYKLLQPKYHIIIDDKFYKGEWGIDIIDKILELNPNVTFIFNVKWAFNKKFTNEIIKNKELKIVWIDNRLFLNKYNFKKFKINLTTPTFGGAVFGAALSFLAYTNPNSILFVGVEANGLCYELIDNFETHAYGSNPDNNKKKFQNYIEDLDQMSITLNQYRFWSEYFKRKNIAVYNCTGAGILKIFKQKKIEEVLN